MKKTTDPLKKVAKETSSADATRVDVNLPKAPTRERISNIPNRFKEKQDEQIRMMRERGYIPMYKSDGKGGMALEGYSPQGKDYAMKYREEQAQALKNKK